jgi:hypothetical protein
MPKFKRFNSEGCPTSLLDKIPSPGPFGENRAADMAKVQAAGVRTGDEEEIDRVLQLAGALSQYGRSPILEHYDEIFRVEPNDSWFDPARNPNNPTQFEIGAVSAEAGRYIFIFDYSIRPFGFSGVAPNDVRPLPEGELSGSFGYVLRVSGRSPGIINYRLNPTSPTLRRTQFKFNERKLRTLSDLSADDFARTRAKQFASAAGYGGEVHPQQPGRFGARNVPFTLNITEDRVLSMTGVIFNRVATPLAFVEGRVSGYITSAVVGNKLERDLRETVR